MIRRGASAALLLGLFAVLFIALSRMPMSLDFSGDALLTVAFRNTTRAGLVCRPVTEAEKAGVPAHMRRDQICTGGRSRTWLRIRVDGVERWLQAYKPLGLRSDMSSIGMASIALPEGRHRFEIALRDTENEAEWNHRFDREVELKRDQRYLVEYDAGAGFRVYDRVTE